MRFFYKNLDLCGFYTNKNLDLCIFPLIKNRDLCKMSREDTFAKPFF